MILTDIVLVNSPFFGPITSEFEVTPAGLKNSVSAGDTECMGIDLHSV